MIYMDDMFYASSCLLAVTMIAPALKFLVALFF